MSISILNNKISQVFYGGTEIKEVYKGTELLYRKSGGIGLIIASDEALSIPLQKGDTIKINDGMGRTHFPYTGFPINTTEQGNFTITSTITDVQKDKDGNTVYSSNFTIPTNEVSIISNENNVEISSYGGGDRVDVLVNASEDGSEIKTDAGLTESNSVYEGDYTIVGKIEPLPDCFCKLEIGGQRIDFDTLPSVFNRNSVLSFIVKKDGKLRNYKNIVLNQDLTDMLVRSFSINVITPEAVPTINYVITTDQNVLTQTNGVVYGYSGDTLTYEITADGYKAVSGSYDFTEINKVLDVELEEVKGYENVYSNKQNVQVDDEVLVNGGLGQTQYTWTANDTSDTDYTGDFTVIGDVKSISSDGLLSVNAPVLEKFEVSLVANQNDSNILTYGDETVNVNISVDEDGAEITSNAGLDTVTSSIIGNRILHLESLDNYDFKIQNSGQNLETNKYYLVSDGQVLSIVLKYNGVFASYIQTVINKDLEFKKHTFTINPNVSGATVKLYGIETNGINCYSGQVINYEVNADGYDTVTGSYTVPQNSSNNMNFTLDIEL